MPNGKERSEFCNASPKAVLSAPKSKKILQTIGKVHLSLGQKYQENNRQSISLVAPKISPIKPLELGRTYLTLPILGRSPMVNGICNYISNHAESFTHNHINGKILTITIPDLIAMRLIAQQFSL